MSQTISVSTTMGEQGFRDFAVFDAFHHRKAWLRPAVFAAIMLAFAAVCLSQLGKRPGAGLLAAVLAIVGIGLPVSYFYSFFRSVSRQIKQMHLPRAFYRVRDRHCCVDVRPAGQTRSHQPPRMGQLLLRLPHRQCGVPLRRKRESLLTERPHGSGVEVFGRHPAQRKAARLQKRVSPKNMHMQKRTADISFSSSFLL